MKKLVVEEGGGGRGGRKVETRVEVKMPFVGVTGCLEN